MPTGAEHNHKEIETTMALHRWRLPDEQLRRFEGYAGEILAALGMDLTTPSTRDTPRTYIEALLEATEGYDGDPKLIKVFDTECRGGPDCRLGQVFSFCEHHALPFHGEAYVGCIAHERTIGISKLARVVRLFARRFTIQERLKRQIADTLVGLLQPHGIAVYLQAHHLCGETRGVRGLPPKTRTTMWRGEYENNPDLRAELFVACGLKR